MSVFIAMILQDKKDKL